MPIDYSKFDNIDDSDEESAPKAVSHVTSSNALAKKAPAGARVPTGARRSTLEPSAGFEDRLRIVPSDTGVSDIGEAASELFPWPVTQSGATALPKLQEAPPKPDEPKRLCMNSDGRKKIHTTFHDGAEMVEEFDEKTDILLLRKTRRPTKLGGEGEWVFEVGQAPELAFDPHADLMRASSSNPIFMRKDTPEHLQWRIRNLPYPANVYSVLADHEKQEIVVRTSNKKYYKRIQVPDLTNIGLTLLDELLSWKHQHNTLIISYSKPRELLEQEQKMLKEADRSSLKL